MAATLSDLAVRYLAIRRATEALTAPLSPEDMTVQSMPDASPVKWHLAHTTWFFETFLLKDLPGYRPFHPDFAFLFNSYYEALGPRHARPRRGLLTRPSLEEIRAYRAHVDAALQDSVERLDAGLLELGLNHEQQHQELILTDLKHLLAQNPLRPSYGAPTRPSAPAAPLAWIPFGEGLFELGHRGAGFAFDNEVPCHTVFLQSFELANRPVTNGEYLAFVEDGGYTRPGLWLSDGWALVQAEGWTAPLYWERGPGGWKQFTLAGLRDLDPDEPACHLSYYEADAYARWTEARLPTEAEWERAMAGLPIQGNLLESGAFHPRAATGAGLLQGFGDVWEWTCSAYLPYPGFRPAPGAVGEYNGKFMINQMVLRGGSCATSASHLRATYRNFFPPHARWQFSGLRLARDL
ncbi:MAG TPA: ergothioneine biosynthesis protein EgtB [Holophagaceae bacterium]|nr:ergothioneine biosynthesis protein EgtB [Holophagaceae bacterium]